MERPIRIYDCLTKNLSLEPGDNYLDFAVVLKTNGIRGDFLSLNICTSFENLCPNCPERKNCPYPSK